MSELARDFYRNGFLNCPFGSKELCDVLKTIGTQDIDSNFKLDSKYPDTYDLRPCAIDYSNIFIEELFNARIDELLSDICKGNMVLHHVQVRLLKSTGRSYMDWHRDTYFDEGRLGAVGMFPPPVKLIFMPDLNGEALPSTTIAVASHRKMEDTLSKDLGQLHSFKIHTNRHSNNTAFVFDASALHRAEIIASGKESIRLIYSFLDLSQIDREGLHARTAELYNDYRYSRLR